MKTRVLLFLLLVCMIGGCGQKEITQEVKPTLVSTLNEEIIPIIQTSGGGAPSPTGIAKENGVFRYTESEYTTRFAVDENGLVYGIGYTFVYPGDRKQVLEIYDWEGNCIERQIFDIMPGKAKDLIVGENCLYLLGPEEDCANVLYRIDLTTWEVKRLYDFTEFEFVFDMVLLGDTLYILGEYENFKEKEFFHYEDWYAQSNGSNYVVAYLHINEETLELSFVPFDLPMYIFAIDENTLGIYGKEERYRYRLFAYSPAENTFQGISNSYSTGEDIYRRPFQFYEDGIFMVYNWQSIYYISSDGTEYEILHTDNKFYDRSRGVRVYNRKIVCVNGYLFYQYLDNSDIDLNFMERMYIGDKLKEIQSK